MATYKIEKHNTDPNFKSAPETCTHEGTVVAVSLAICGEQVDQVCTHCGLAI